MGAECDNFLPFFLLYYCSSCIYDTINARLAKFLNLIVHSLLNENCVVIFNTWMSTVFGKSLCLVLDTTLYVVVEIFLPEQGAISTKCCTLCTLTSFKSSFSYVH